VENILFIRAVSNFERAAEKSEAAAGEISRRIMQEFLLRHSLSELNVDADAKDHVIQKIRQGDFPPDLFAEMKRLVAMVITQDTIPRWQRELQMNPPAAGKRASPSSFSSSSSPSLPSSHQRNPRLAQLHSELA